MILKIDNLHKRFGGIKAIDDVSFTVNEGEIIAVVGPNGAGKTTLLNLISGFIKPDKGKILFKGRDITGMSPSKIAELGIARTFQIPRPLHKLPTIFNIVIPLLSPRVKRLTGGVGDELVRAIDILEEVGFERDSDYIRKPAGLLPHGYLKRIELARALALRPEILLLDELLSGLSRPEVTSILPLLTRLKDRGFTIIMVEHRVRDVSAIADRMIVLNEGVKIMEGTPEEVMTNEKVIEIYVGRRGELA
jgi:branched-chain amino acid transport system ATP-binding protein